MGELCRVHEWVWTGERYACSQCGEVTAGCVACPSGEGVLPRATLGPEILLCRQCHNRLGSLLSDAVEALEALPDVLGVLGGLRGTSYDLTSVASLGAPLPFGLSALVEEWPGSKDEPWDRNRPTTVPGAMDLLIDVVASWKEFGLPVSRVTDLRPFLVSAARVLPRELWEASQLSIERATWLVRRVAGYGASRTDMRCYDSECEGGQLLRDYTDEGLSDDAYCEKCGREYDEDGQLLAQRQAIRLAPEYVPEKLVTQRTALAIFPQLAVNTLHVWTWRDRSARERWERKRLEWESLPECERGVEPVEPVPILPIAGRNRFGESEFRVGDIAAALARHESKD